MDKERLALSNSSPAVLFGKRTHYHHIQKRSKKLWSLMQGRRIIEAHAFQKRDTALLMGSCWIHKWNILGLCFKFRVQGYLWKQNFCIVEKRDIRRKANQHLQPWNEKQWYSYLVVAYHCFIQSILETIDEIGAKWKQRMVTGRAFTQP